MRRQRAGRLLALAAVGLERLVADRGLGALQAVAQLGTDVAVPEHDPPAHAQARVGGQWQQRPQGLGHPAARTGRADVQHAGAAQRAGRGMDPLHGVCAGDGRVGRERPPPDRHGLEVRSHGAEA